MLKYFIAFYAAIILLAVFINVTFDGQMGAIGGQQLTNSELGLSSIN